MSENSLQQLASLGQSFWLDFIGRELITSGELRRLIDRDGLRGITSNPSIFEKAIAHSTDYAADIQLLSQKGKTPEFMYESMSQCDVQMAADEFRVLYEKSNGLDGYVSLEVNPHLAYNTMGTIREARRLWSTLNRPNVLIKVPATQESLPAITELISEGINVNVTLLFGLNRYEQVAEAYIAGIQARLHQGNKVDHVASVASFFLSRIDSLIDPLLEKIIATGSPDAEIAARIHGQAAIASARMAYRKFQEIFNKPDFGKLVSQGARVQRLLWASTGTKNPHYSDISYVEALIGKDTVTTIPLDTVNAYRDHGVPAARLDREVDSAAQVLQSLSELGIDLQTISEKLELEGVNKFIEPFDQLLATLRQSRVLTT